MPPTDARIWDVKGLTIYAGFIEPYLVTGTNSPVQTSDWSRFGRPPSLQA